MRACIKVDNPADLWIYNDFDPVYGIDIKCPGHL